MVLCYGIAIAYVHYEIIPAFSLSACIVKFGFVAVFYAVNLVAVFITPIPDALNPLPVAFDANFHRHKSKSSLVRPFLQTVELRLINDALWVFSGGVR